MQQTVNLCQVGSTPTLRTEQSEEQRARFPYPADPLLILFMKHGAGIILVRKDLAVLMQHRDNKPTIFYPDHWCYPAGDVEGEESFEDAAKRELKEETGYQAKEVFELVNEIYTRSDGEKVNRHIYWTLYDDLQPIECYEGQEMKFVKQSEFKGKQFITGQQRLFLLAIEKAKLFLD